MRSFEKIHCASPDLKKLFKFIIGAAATLGTVMGTLAIIYPAISVTANDPLKSIDPFTALFIVSDDGSLPINSVNFECKINHAITSHENTFDSVGLKSSQFYLQNLSPGEKTSAPCPFNSTIKMSQDDIFLSADINIIVNYKVFSWPQIREFRFTLYRASEGKAHWYPQPASALK
jgi:hypothetical protein